jgi:hypothetical protein
VEAAAERAGGSVSVPVDADSVLAFLAAPETASEAVEPVTGRVSLATRESDSAILFETRDAAQPAAWLHRSYVAK